MGNQPTQPTKKNEKATPKEIFQAFLFFIVIGLVGWFIYSVYIAPSGAKYTATLNTNSFNIVNPATLGVSFHVKNTGSKAGTPYCTINVSDVNDNYTGVDAFTLKTIQPGQTVTSVDNLTITKQGAQYVTTGTISCN